MHHDECSCYQGCKNIELKAVGLKEPDCVMIWMNWFYAENFFDRQIPKRISKNVLITYCGLFYLTKGEGCGKEKRERL